MITSFFIFLVGIAAGFIGAFGGGGGGFLSLATMLFMGLPPSVAIATHRFSSLGMSTTAIARYLKSDKLVLHYALILCIFGVIGGILGGFTLLHLNEEILEYIIIGCLLILAPLMLFKPQFGLEMKLTDPKSLKAIIGYIAFTTLMILSAFSGPGLGILFLFLNVYFFGLTIIQSNATGMPSFWLMNIFAVSIFAWNGLIVWDIGIALILGSALGGWLGASFAIKQGESIVKLTVVGICVIMGITLLVR